jgi:hypothetical protein
MGDDGSNTDNARSITVTEAIKTCKERYGFHTSRAMLYRRAGQGYFTIVEEDLPHRPRILIDAQELRDYYEKIVGLPLLEAAASATDAEKPADNAA